MGTIRIAQTPESTLVHFEPPLSEEQAKEVRQRATSGFNYVDGVYQDRRVQLDPANRHSHADSVFELDENLGFDSAFNNGTDEIHTVYIEHWVRDLVGNLAGYTLCEGIRNIGPVPVEDVGAAILATFEPTY